MDCLRGRQSPLGPTGTLSADDHEGQARLKEEVPVGHHQSAGRDGPSLRCCQPQRPRRSRALDPRAPAGAERNRPQRWQQLSGPDHLAPHRHHQRSRRPDDYGAPAARVHSDELTIRCLLSPPTTSQSASRSSSASGTATSTSAGASASATRRRRLASTSARTLSPRRRRRRRTSTPLGLVTGQ